MKLIFPTLLVTVLFSGLPELKARELSIADYITDPGFETAHEVNQQINAPEVKEVNGWNAIPANGNFWTSLSYVDAGGTSMGDKREAIKPAEGKSYLRMYTEKSSNWLALRTPSFELKNDTTYAISFKVAADTQTTMSRVDVGLRDSKGAYYGVQSYDLKSLGADWETIIYRFRYEGPNQPGVLQITARREEAGTTGVLNIDDFKIPDSTEVGIRPIEN